jgi:hypothetical protein
VAAGVPGGQFRHGSLGGQVTVEVPGRLRAFWLRFRSFRFSPLCFSPLRFCSLRAVGAHLLRLPEGDAIVRLPHGEASRRVANIRHDSEA